MQLNALPLEIMPGAAHPAKQHAGLKLMIIGLDYDRTYTKDSDLWNSFIDLAQNRGHKVIIITMRSRQEPIESKAILYRCEVIYTNRVPKLFAVKPRVDIWIDDNPCDITGYPK